MNKPKLLDLYCCAGGATKGYQRAGFYVVGVDIEQQPNYCGDEFYQADALAFDLSGYDAIHASPPCQAYSVLKGRTTKQYPKLIPETRQRLMRTGKPYVIENVAGAKKDLINPLLLCGTMFNLNVIRHRLFEMWPPLYWPPMSCGHLYKVAKQGTIPIGKQYHCVVGNCAGIDKARQAMGIDWTNRKELAQAIPPAYTEYIGRHLISVLTANRIKNERIKCNE